MTALRALPSFLPPRFSMKGREAFPSSLFAFPSLLCEVACKGWILHRLRTSPLSPFFPPLFSIFLLSFPSFPLSCPRWSARSGKAGDASDFFPFPPPPLLNPYDFSFFIPLGIDADVKNESRREAPGCAPPPSPPPPLFLDFPSTPLSPAMIVDGRDDEKESLSPPPSPPLFFLKLLLSGFFLSSSRLHKRE